PPPYSDQNPVNITFDGPPYLPPNYQVDAHSYAESGMVFSGDFSRMHTNTAAPGYPRDGSSYIQEGIAFSFNRGGNLFGLGTVDLAAYSTVVTNMEITFIGHRVDGSTIMTNFSGTGIAF